MEHVKTCFNQKLLFFDFCVEYFLKNAENRLFLNVEYDFWSNFEVTVVKK